MSLFAGSVALAGAGERGFLVPKLISGLDHVSARPPRTWVGRGAALVHRQTLFTPEDAREQQPAFHDNGRWITMFDGRLDNRADLIGRLSPHACASDADGDLVRAAFDLWGADTPARLRGPFAVAAWDPHARCLVMARDAFGERSLFFRQDDDVITFGTRMAAVVAAAGIVPSVSLEGLIGAELSVPHGPTGTLYREIQTVPAASTTVFEPGTPMRTTTHWSFDWQRTVRFARDDEYVDAARALLDRAVTRCLRSSGPVVTTLSGGLDSSGVAATAARLIAPRPVIGFTVVPDSAVPHYAFPGRMTDEGPMARLIASQHGNLESRIVRATSSFATSEDERRLLRQGYLPQLSHTSWFFPMFDEMLGAGAMTVLTGAWGNSTLSRSGIPGLTDLLRAGELRSFYRQTRALALHRHRSPLRMMASLAKRTWLPSLSRPRRGVGETDPSLQLFNPDFVRHHRLNERLADEAASGKGEAQFRRLALERQQYSNHGASIDVLRGLDIRSPLMDRDLAEFCLALPVEQFLRDGTHRWLARRTLADRLPDGVLNEQRRSRQQPEFMYRLGLQRAAILRDLDAFQSDPTTSAVLNVRAMRALVDAWPADITAGPFTEYLTVLDQGRTIGRFLQAAASGGFWLA